MISVKLKKKLIPKLKKDEMFPLALLLSRLLNVINSNHRQYLRVKEDDNPANLVDRIDLILYHGAIVYEAIRRIEKYKPQLAKLKYWRANKKTINLLLHKSTIHECIKALRNEVIFHYNLDPIKDTIVSFPFDTASPFAEGKSRKRGDLTFSLSTEILLNYALTTIENDKTDKEKWAYIQNKLLDLSNGIADFLNYLLLEMFEMHKDYFVIKETKSCNKL